MVNLKLLKFTPKEKPDYYSIYRRIFLQNAVNGLDSIEKTGVFSPEIASKIVFFGIKMFNANHRETNTLNYEEVEANLLYIRTIQTAISFLTPKTLQTIFPISKEYDGERYGTKDYFYTIDRINEWGENKEIGTNVEDVLFDYQNRDIRLFMVKTLSHFSHLSKLQGGKSFAEQMADDLGLTTYTLNKTPNGKEFLTNNQTGESVKVTKKRPRYLQVL